MPESTTFTLCENLFSEVRLVVYLLKVAGLVTLASFVPMKMPQL